MDGGSIYINIDPVRQYFPDVPIKDNNKKNMILTIFFMRKFFDNYNRDISPDYNYKGSVIYINSCNSVQLAESFSSAKLYVGNNDYADVWWEKSMGYYFFHYMMSGPIVPNQVPGYDKIQGPIPQFDQNKPMHIKEAIDALTSYMVNPDPQTYKDTTTGEILSKSNCRLVPVFHGDPNTEDEVYFPVNVPVTIHKK